MKQGATELSKAIPNFQEILNFLETKDPCLKEHLLKFNPDQFCLDEPLIT